MPISQHEDRDHGLPYQIHTFINAMAEWFHRRQIRTLKAEFVATALDPHGTQYRRLSEDIHDARNVVKHTGEALARTLLESGHDPRGLLKVVFFVCDGGGPDSVATVWADVRAELQALRLKVEASEPIGKQLSRRCEDPKDEVPIPKRPPESPSRVVSRTYAADRWFRCHLKTLNQMITDGQCRAHMQSERRWQFDRDDVEVVNPDAYADTDPTVSDEANVPIQSASKSHKLPLIRTNS